MIGYFEEINRAINHMAHCDDITACPFRDEQEQYHIFAPIFIKAIVTELFNKWTGGK